MTKTKKTPDRKASSPKLVKKVFLLGSFLDYPVTVTCSVSSALSPEQVISFASSVRCAFDSTMQKAEIAARIDDELAGTQGLLLSARADADAARDARNILGFCFLVTLGILVAVLV